MPIQFPMLPQGSEGFATIEEYKLHTEDNDIHVTIQDKERWNAGGETNPQWIIADGATGVAYGAMQTDYALSEDGKVGAYACRDAIDGTLITVMVSVNGTPFKKVGSVDDAASLSTFKIVVSKSGNVVTLIYSNETGDSILIATSTSGGALVKSTFVTGEQLQTFATDNGHTIVLSKINNDYKYNLMIDSDPNTINSGLLATLSGSVYVRGIKITEDASTFVVVAGSVSQANVMTKRGDNPIEIIGVNGISATGQISMNGDGTLLAVTGDPGQIWIRKNFGSFSSKTVFPNNTPVGAMYLNITPENVIQYIAIESPGTLLLGTSVNGDTPTEYVIDVEGQAGQPSFIRTPDKNSVIVFVGIAAPGTYQVSDYMNWSLTGNGVPIQIFTEDPANCFAPLGANNGTTRIIGKLVEKATGNVLGMYEVDNLTTWVKIDDMHGQLPLEMCVSSTEDILFFMLLPSMAESDLPVRTYFYTKPAPAVFEEAPLDGKQYGRQNGGWVEIKKVDAITEEQLTQVITQLEDSLEKNAGELSDGEKQDVISAIEAQIGDNTSLTVQEIRDIINSQLALMPTSLTPEQIQAIVNDSITGLVEYVVPVPDYSKPEALFPDTDLTYAPQGTGITTTTIVRSEPYIMEKSGFLTIRLRYSMTIKQGIQAFLLLRINGNIIYRSIFYSTLNYTASMPTSVYFDLGMWEVSTGDEIVLQISSSTPNDPTTFTASNCWFTYYPARVGTQDEFLHADFATHQEVIDAVSPLSSKLNDLDSELNDIHIPTDRYKWNDVYSAEELIFTQTAKNAGLMLDTDNATPVPTDTVYTVSSEFGCFVRVVAINQSIDDYTMTTIHSKNKTNYWLSQGFQTDASTIKTFWLFLGDTIQITGTGTNMSMVTPLIKDPTYQTNEVTYTQETTLYQTSAEIPHVQGETGDIPLSPLLELVLHSQNDQGYWKILQEVANKLNSTQALNTQMQEKIQDLVNRIAVLEDQPVPEPDPIYDMAAGLVLHTPALLGLLGIQIGGVDEIGSGWTAPSDGLLVLDGASTIGLLTPVWIAVDGVKADPSGTVLLQLLGDGQNGQIVITAGQVITQSGMGNITFYKRTN